MAAWVSEPPPSHTQPAINAKAGVQFGDVASQTRISPSSSSGRSVAETMTLARPVTVPGEAGKPWNSVASASALRFSK